MRSVWFLIVVALLSFDSSPSLAQVPTAEQLELLRNKPELTKNAVEEFLRYDGSVQINHRVALDGMTVGDVDIPARGMIYVFLGAVNRDPARYPEPDRLDESVRETILWHLAAAA